MKINEILNKKFVIAAIICICLFVVAIVPKTLQNDTYYTIKLGELILQNGIDMQEHFAWHEGLPYTYPHWLYDVIMYLIISISGFNGIYVSSIILGAILGITIYATSCKLCRNTVIPFFTTIAVLYIGKDFITARAQLITFILFVLTIYFIEKLLAIGKKRYIVYLLIIPTLIANIHAAVFPFYFVLYLPYLGEYIVSVILNKINYRKFIIQLYDIDIRFKEKKKNKTQEDLEEIEILKSKKEQNIIKLEKISENKEEYKVIIKNNKNMKLLVLAVILACFTGLITPIGDTPYTYLIHTMKGNTTQNISEHLPIVLYNYKYVLIYISVIIAVIAFTKIKIRLSDLFLLGGLIFLTIMSVRQYSMLVFIGILIVNKILTELLLMYNKDVFKEAIKYLSLNISLVIIFSTFILTSYIGIKLNKESEIISKKLYPVEAVNFIKQNLNLEEIKLFNEYDYGSYLLYCDIPVFIDSRADVYDPQFNKWEDDIFKDFVNISSLNVDYEEKFEHYGITHVIIKKKSNLNKLLSKDNNYLEIYNDGTFLIYERYLEIN